MVLPSQTKGWRQNFKTGVNSKTLAQLLAGSWWKTLCLWFYLSPGGCVCVCVSWEKRLLMRRRTSQEYTLTSDLMRSHIPFCERGLLVMIREHHDTLVSICILIRQIFLQRFALIIWSWSRTILVLSWMQPPYSLFWWKKKEKKRNLCTSSLTICLKISKHLIEQSFSWEVRLFLAIQCNLRFCAWTRKGESADDITLLSNKLLHFQHRSGVTSKRSFLIENLFLGKYLWIVSGRETIHCWTEWPPHDQ